MSSPATSPTAPSPTAEAPAQEYSKRKVEYYAKLEQAFNTYKSCIIIGKDNVSSSQVQQIRIALRGKAYLLLGKNTLARKYISANLKSRPELKGLIDRLHGNCGFIFTNEDVKTVRDIAIRFKVEAPARVGVLAPNDVIVPPGPTGMDPGQTGYFQAMGIPTKIMKGNIEITAEVQLLRKGQKVGNSEVSLLSKLGIKPFLYGMTAHWVCDQGEIYPASVLDMSSEDLLQKFMTSVGMVAALSREINYPTVLSVGPSLQATISKVFALGLVLQYSIKQLEPLKKLLSDPEALKKMQAEKAAAADKKEEKKDAKKDGKKEDKKETKKVEEEDKKEEEPDMGMDLFG
jgi:large subunit ribosomal protein LP0